MSSKCIRLSITIITVLAALGGLARAQGTRADYKRAAELGRMTDNTVFKTSVRPHWFDSGKRFWYRNDLPDRKREFILVDPARGSRAPAFDHAKVAAGLSEALKRKCAADKLPIDLLEFVADEIHLQVGRAVWKYSTKTHKVTRSKIKPKAIPKRRPRRRHHGMGGFRGRQTSGNRSPNGKMTAFVKDFNIHIRIEGDKKSKKNAKDAKESWPVTKNGTEGNPYVNRVSWSPDSKKLVAMRIKPGKASKMYLIESCPKGQLHPKLHTRNYARPGDPIDTPRPYLFDIEKRKEIPVSNKLFETPWRLSHVNWSADSKRFTFFYNQRGHQAVRIVAVDAASGTARALIDETCKTFFDHAFKLLCHWPKEDGEIIWASERDGWNHLYLFYAKTGKIKNQITKGKWLVRGIDRIDDAKRQIWFHAGGIIPGQDPYHVHLARINFDGSGLTLLTRGDGTHRIQYSPDKEKKYFIDNYSRVDDPGRTELRRTSDGKLVCVLETADMTALKATKWKMPLRFTAKARDGKTDIWGVIYRPTNLDESKVKKYPVIEHIYAGPQGAYTPKHFSRRYNAQAMAELGFIVVQLDGMGTSHRSKAFHDYCFKNIADAGLPDRMLWIKAAAKQYPYMDISRVGIYGGSAGGQNAMRAVLDYPDFYKVAVASAGCHDNRMDKIWWNEAWMSWPVGPHYKAQSNTTDAHKLRGKLMLIVGEMDTNVDPASTLQVVDALIKADKDFDMLYIPGYGHGDGGRYGMRRRSDFFVRHLLGVEPRSR